MIGFIAVTRVQVCVDCLRIPLEQSMSVLGSSWEVWDKAVISSNSYFPFGTLANTAIPHSIIPNDQNCLYQAVSQESNHEFFPSA